MNGINRSLEFIILIIKTTFKKEQDEMQENVHLYPTPRLCCEVLEQCN